MNTILYILLLIILYTLLWFKGNANKIYGFNMQPWQWWLYTGLFTNYLGLMSWWHLLEKYEIWGAIAITYILHAVIETGLSLYFFDPPTLNQTFGLSLLLVGGFLVLR